MEMPLKEVIGFINGVDVGKLEATIDAVNNNPDLAAFRFHIANEWINGTKTETAAQRIDGGPQVLIRTEPFKIRSDQPCVLMGADTAPCAAVSLMHALASCLSTSIVYAASLRGIEIKKMSIILEGDVDIQGVLGISEQIKPGLTNLDLDIRIDSNSPKQEIEEIVQYAQKHSMILDTLINQMNLDINLV